MDLSKRITMIGLYFFNMYYFAGWIVNGFGQSDVGMLVTFLVDIFIFVCGIFLYRQELTRALKTIYSDKLKNIRIGLLVFIVYFLLSWFVQYFFGMDQNSGNQESIIETLKSLPFGFKAILIAEISIMGPIKEELVFRRSMIFKETNRKWAIWLSLLFSSIVFGFIHLVSGENPIQAVPYVLSGFILGGIYLRTNTIIFPIIVHIINNSFFFLM